MSRDYIVLIVFRQSIAVPSFMIVRYVQQSLGIGGLFGPSIRDQLK